MCTCVPHHTHVYFTKHLSEYYTKLPVIFQFSLSLLLFQLLPSEKFVNTLYQNISSITLLVLFFVFNALVLCIYSILFYLLIWMNTCIAYCMFCFTYEMYSYVLFHILHVLPCTTTVQARSCIWARFPTHIFPTVILFHVWMSQWTKGMNSNFWNPNFMAQFECLVQEQTSP